MTISLEELQAKLKAAGIEGQWVEMGGTQFEPETFKKQRERLVQVRGHLQRQLQDDLQLVAMLREELNRVKRGGGS